MRECLRLALPMDEAFGVLGPCLLEGALPLDDHCLGAAVMDIGRCKHRDPPWRCSSLYHRKKVRQKPVAAWMSAKRPGKPG